MDFLGQSLWVLHLRNGSKFCPPVWHIHLVGLPIQPCFNVLNRRFRQVILSTSSIQVAMGISRRCTVSHPWASGGAPLLPSTCISKECPQGSLEGTSLAPGFISDSQNVTLLSNQCLLGYFRCLSKDQLCGLLLL